MGCLPSRRICHAPLSRQVSRVYDVQVDSWAWWLVVGAGLCIPLVITAMPEFGLLAAGAGVAAIAAALGGSVMLEIVIFAVASVALLVVVRPIALRHLRQGPVVRTGVDALKGASAVVLERVDSGGGRIKLQGEVWSARALYDEQSFEPGRRVDVVDIEGATAVVV